MNIDNKSNGKQSVDPELGVKVTKLGHKYRSEGLDLDSIKYYFIKEFKYELNLKREGFDCVHQLIQCLIEDNYPIQLITDSEGTQRLSSDLKHYYHWLSKIKINKCFHLMDILADIPEDVISCGQQLPEFQFPDNIVFNEMPEILSGDILNDLNYSEVRLMSIRSPHEMYLQLSAEDYHYSYHRLRADMSFYEQKESTDKYRIPALLLFEGLFCAVPYPKYLNQWHRTRILSVDRHNNCKVFLIDIGDILEVNASELRLLLKRFCQLPAQGVKVQLVGIRPFGKSGQQWHKWAKNFVKKLEEYNYCGKINCAFVDRRCDRFGVFIKFYDRFKSINTNDLLFLHQILVDKQLAVISSFDEPIDELSK